MKMNAMDKLAYVLVVVRGINWGLVGWFKYNLVDKIFGVESGLSRVVYAVVEPGCPVHVLYHGHDDDGQGRKKK